MENSQIIFVPQNSQVILKKLFTPSFFAVEICPLCKGTSDVKFYLLMEMNLYGAVM